jgi:hypothetical protein
MSLLTRTLPVPVALALLTSAGIAKEIKGAPGILLGIFAGSSELCRTYYRRTSDFPITIWKGKGNNYYYATCFGKMCQFQVLSHKTDPAGFVLRLREVGSPDRSTEQTTVRRISNNEFVFTERDRAPRNFTRCTDADLVAGIGLQAQDARPEPDYAVYYGLAVPGLCPGLAIDRDAVNKRLGTVKPVAERWAKDDAEYDKEKIKDYCHQVIKAFGPDGRVIPDLLFPAESKR